MSAAVADPYAAAPHAGAVRFLYRLNPLAKLAAVIPPMLVLVFVRDTATPAAFTLLAVALLLVGVRFTPRLAGLVFVVLPAAVLLIGLGFAVWADPARTGDTTAVVQVGAWTLTIGALQSGLATSLRLTAILALSLLPGVSTTGPDLARALVQQLHVPYRIGYTALAAFRFVPRFGRELEIIRQAHRVRGARSGNGPLARILRGTGYVVPLLAGGIRHAERVALAMDARGFGAHRTRTERHDVPWRVRDTVFVAAMWAGSAAVFAATLGI